MVYESGFALDIQARSSTIANFVDDAVRYDLDSHTFEMLRDPVEGPMRLLVVLVLPNDEREWLRLTEEELLLRRAVYWYNLRGAAATKNRRSIRVFISTVAVVHTPGLHDFTKGKLI